MLRSEKSLKGYRIHAKDGEIGRVHDFLADDALWFVRYMVVDTGSLIPRRKVLISPQMLDDPDGAREIFPVERTIKQIKESPEIDTAMPVSRQHHQEALAFGLMATTPWPVTAADPVSTVIRAEEEPDVVRLRSLNELRGYVATARDGTIGRIRDFILDSDEWLIRYVVVDMGTLFAGRKVLLPVGWLLDVSWAERTAHFDIDKSRVQGAPVYEPTQPVNRSYELRVYDYYGRPRYWER